MLKNSMIMLTTLMWGTNLIVAAPSNNDPTLKRSFTLTPGYMERTFNSNEMMKHGSLSLMQLYSKGFDEVGETVFCNEDKLLLYAAFSIPCLVLAANSSVVYHEFGHARAFASYGVAYNYSAALSSNVPTDYAYGLYLQKLLSPSLLFDGAYTRPLTSLNYSKFPKTLLDRHLKSSSKYIANILNEMWKNSTTIDEKKIIPLRTINTKNFST